VNRFLVLTPSIGGRDGISELSRLVVRALAIDYPVEIWALDGEPADTGMADASTTFWSAQGSRARLVSHAVVRAVNASGDLPVVVTHLHLAPVALALAARGARLVTFLVGVEAWRPIRARERRALERADCLIAISRYTERRFRAANPDVRLSSDIRVCLLGIRPVPPGIPPGRERGFALIVGRICSEERYKGHERLIEIWRSVRASVPGARLLVVGDGDDRARLERSVEAAGLSDVIRFAGHLGDTELVSLYRSCAFFVMPSANEGFGLVYLEAMQAGKPCIGVHGSADEILEQGVSGLVVDADSREALLHAIVQLFTDADLRDRMGAAAVARVAGMFTDQHFAGRLRAALCLPALAPVST